ncbi:MAG: amino acid adenylation domain-containing protein, partial [Bacteroidota bacterium]
ENLLRIFQERQITHSFVPTALVADFVETSRNQVLDLKYLTTGGDALVSIDINGLSYQIVNGYGPTENTVFSSTYILGPKDKQRKPPIGKELDNVQIYLLDSIGQLVPNGVIGEIYLGGNNLSKGYLRRPELTKERFIKHPFLVGKKLYKTGDLARRLSDGNLEFLGRSDDQVQIRGIRIELGEIETTLDAHPSVRQSRVLAEKDQTGHLRLIAFVLPQDDFHATQVLENLKAQLPAAMIPSMIVPIEAFPVTPNGKIDKRALLSTDFSGFHAQEYVEPQNPMEEQLVGIWQHLLKVEKIGIYNNFFDLGGHSLMATRLVSTIRKEMSFDIKVKDIFANPTVESLAKCLQTHRTTDVNIIALEERPEKIPLSFAQERLWFIDRVEGSIHYHMPMAFILEGQLDRDAFQMALRSIVNRHESLRTIFVEAGNELYQEVMEQDQWYFETVEDLRDWKEEAIREWVYTKINLPFDLSKDHMIKAHLSPIPEGKHLLIMVMHHIASDGWSMSIFMNELKAYYEALIAKKTVAFPALPIQYADYAIWQRQHVQGERLEQQLAYWKENLKDIRPLELPTDLPRPKLQSTAGREQHFHLPNAIWQQLKAVARKEEVSDFMLLLSVFKVLLHRYSGQNDICVGTPVANRTHSEIEPLIGFFINALALRTDLGDNPNFKELLQKVKASTLGAFSNQDAPFENVLEQVDLARDLSRTPLFQVMFSLANNEEAMESTTIGELNFVPIDSGFDSAKYDLTVVANDIQDGLLISINYCSDLFLPETIDRMQAHFQNLLEQVAQSADQRIGDLQMLSEADEQQIIEGFNPTQQASPYTATQTVVSLFRDQSRNWPDKTVLIEANRKLTYKELEEKSNQLAHYLVEQGVQPNTLVSVCMNRSIDLITSILAILKTGAAYVPIDPSYPDERIRFTLEDTDSEFVLIQEESNAFQAQTEKVQVVSFVEVNDLLEKEPKNALDIVPSQDQLAYVIYTSGSTGKPKGVMIEHRSLLNLIHWHRSAYELNDESRATLTSGIGFDASVWEIWPYLSSGNTLLIVNDEDRLSAERMMSLIKAHQITHSFLATILTPDFVKASIGQELPLRVLLTGGDSLPAIDTTQLSYRVFNNYGPTENTVVASYYEVTEKDKTKNPPIGQAIFNSQIYLLDDYKNLVPPGVQGELYIAGSSLARGYLNREDLTATKFVQHAIGKDQNVRLYATGDMAYWSKEGQLHFAGRKGEQVQLRGYRIELGEIEATLQMLEQVDQAMVMTKAGDKSSQLLVAYLLSDESLNPKDLRQHLNQHLPHYMIPTHFVQLEQIPITPNGKVDKKALPDPIEQALSSGVEYVAPRNEAEEQLVAIWSELLLLPEDKISIDDNFFDLGGHSMKLVQLNNLIKQKMNLELSMVDMFKFGSIRLLGDYLENGNASSESNDEERADSASLFEDTLDLFNNE